MSAIERRSGADRRQESQGWQAIDRRMNWGDRRQSVQIVRVQDEDTEEVIEDRDQGLGRTLDFT